jgi:SpoVK/Ycf46/Vps4 family AAA+-type ATPase
MQRKAEIMLGEYAEVLETQEPRYSFDDVGGHELLKAWLRKHIVDRVRSGDPDALRRLPKGLIFTGPSGTGKSLLCEALAAEMGFNLTLLRPENIKGGIYGESEQKTARAFAGIRAGTPTLVFIDEIDQALRRGGGGAGGAADAAENNIFKRVLEEVGDPKTRGSVLYIGACNRPDLCDAALLRPGRFDEKIPVLPPAAFERQSYFETLLLRHANGFSIGDVFGQVDWNAVVAASGGWTGAEIEQAVISAYDLYELDEVPMHEAVLQAAESVIPATGDIELHTSLAISACNRKDLIPEAYRARADDKQALQEASEKAAKSDRLRSRRGGGLE